MAKPEEAQKREEVIVDRENPWPGLASFRESDSQFFCGREAETAELMRLVLRGRLTMLYGISGLGKTSLLQAGLFPNLEGRGVFPVYIRLGHDAGSPSLLGQVKSALRREAARRGVEAPEPSGTESLWEYFHRKDRIFWNRRNRPVKPLLVFDQFEEIFTLGARPTRVAYTEEFWSEFSDLTEGRPPAQVRARFEAHPSETRGYAPHRHGYKALISLREDYLPQLDSYRELIPSIFQSRLRLMRMNGEAAQRVVDQAKYLLEPGMGEKIVRFVAVGSPDEELKKLSVEPALLSVVCRELNNSRGQRLINENLLRVRRDEILSTFYERSVEDQPPEMRSFIERELLTVAGERDSEALANALQVPGVNEESIETLVRRRLLRIDESSGVARIELTHDLLTSVIAKSAEEASLEEARQQLRAVREESERARRRLARYRLITAGLVAALLLVAVGATLSEWSTMTTLRNALFDSYQQLQPRQYQPVGVRVIDIDDESLMRVGQWPWPRTQLAQLISRLQDQGVAAIGLDILLAEADSTSPVRALRPWADDPAVAALLQRLPDYDSVLSRQIARGSVVTGFRLTGYANSSRPAASRIVLAGSAPDLFLPRFAGAVTTLPELQSAATGNGALNIFPDSDGVVRRLPLLLSLGDGVFPVLAVEALRVAEGTDTLMVRSSGDAGESRVGRRTGIINVRLGSIQVATDAEGAVWLHYSQPVAERTIPAWKVIAGEGPLEQLEGVIVFIGTSATGLSGLHVNSVDQVISSAEVHAQALEQILQSSFLTQPSWAPMAQALLVIAIGITLVLAIRRFGALSVTAIGSAATAATFLGSWLAFTRFHLLLDPIFPSLIIGAAVVVCVVGEWLATREPRVVVLSEGDPTASGQLEGPHTS